MPPSKAAKAGKSAKAPTKVPAKAPAKAKGKAADAPATRGAKGSAGKGAKQPAKGKAAKAAPAKAASKKPVATKPSTKPAKAPAKPSDKKSSPPTKAPVTTTPSQTPAPTKPAPKKPATSGITGKTLERLTQRLEEERETYTRQAEDLAAEAEALMADREPGDTKFDEEDGEGDTINVERERDLALSASARQAVEEIDQAIERIKAGTYGVCIRCGSRIPVARLEAVPQAALCIECKSRQERRR